MMRSEKTEMKEVVGETDGENRMVVRTQKSCEGDEELFILRGEQ